ncbi:MAG: hypothetical protein V4461_13165 [Pseudomonadota bacterium]
MADITQAKLAAAGKIAFGGFKVVSAVSTALGHGIMGAYLKNHGRMAVAAHIAMRGFESGKELIDEGLEDWKSASA